jgi:glucans biosynthesis protein
VGGPPLHDFVVERARARALQPFDPPDTMAAAAVATLTYGQQRAIRFRDEAAIWRDETPFQLQLFHPVGGFRVPVSLHLVESDTTRTLGFDPSLFRRGDELDGVRLDLAPEAGYAGFRVLSALNESSRVDEVVSFLGASYFRLLGPGHVYGLSSRGLAVDVASPNGEEFPDFREFWIVRPEAAATTLTFYALLDGPSVAGAYRFDLTPGTPGRDGAPPTGTVLEVDARLFARSDIAFLGVAPLTSMYLHGTFRRGGDDDVRPRVHDSEGLLMASAGSEWIWRPLTNRASVQVTSLRDRGPRGFGLVQRDRDFDHYLDLEARYHRRPSEWVEVVGGDWGAGGVTLVEFPTRSEFNDNIVAFWAPDGGLRAGDERRFRYRLHTFDDVRPEQRSARVVRTRIGWDALPGQSDPPPRAYRRIVVDFEGASLDRLDDDVRVEAVVRTSAGEIDDVRVERLPGGGRRATFALRPDGERPADMRLYLRSDTILSETWSYLWRADDGR